MAGTINAGTIRALGLAFSTLFQTSLANAVNTFEPIVSRVSTNKNTAALPWGAILSTMKPFLTERQIDNLKMYLQTIAVIKWENTIAVLRDDIEDDDTGSYSLAIQSMGEDAATYPQVEVGRVLREGFATVIWDGQFWFDTDHPIDGVIGGTQSNHYTAVLTAASYALAKEQLKGLVLPNGRRATSMGQLPLVVPHTLEEEAREILLAERNAAGATNVQRGTAELLVIPEIADVAAGETMWFLCYTGRAVKPIILAERIAAEFNTLDDPDNNEAAFMRDEFLYGVRARWGVGEGPYWYIIGSNGTV